ncbi:MAG TPA: transglutaminase family protein [Bryobacteraceae bacterium]
MGHRNRRDFLRAAGVAPSIFAFSKGKAALAQSAKGGGWRTFEVTTRVEVLKPSGVTRIWAPLALGPLAPGGDTPYQRTLSNTFRSEEGAVRTFESRADALKMVYAEIPAGARPVLIVTSRIATRDRAVNFSGRAAAPAPAPAPAPAMSGSEAKYWLRPTKLLPTDGIVKERAAAITSRARTDGDKARAIYEWIVENTYRKPSTRGCGLGNIRFMLESGDLGGKCADLNALYVGLARASGLPARDVYGIRVAASNLGYKSLGASSMNVTGVNVTKAQHCRAEVYLGDVGWVPVDPADVRKVMLEEPPGNRPLDDEMVKKARARLFGSWEMNWMAYNFAHDVALPNSSGSPVEFLMYPQAETADGRLDCLDPDNFKYEINSREMETA